VNTFEFLSVLLSVVVGLGIANLLNGLGQVLHKHRGMRLSVAHLAWTAFVFFFMVIYWWTVVYGWKDWQHWNILLFLFLLLYGVQLFLLSVILYPRELSTTRDFDDSFIAMRRWFFGMLLFLIVTEIGDSYMKSHLDDFALPYMLLLGSWVAGSIVGWRSENRRVQASIAVYALVTLLCWVGYQLRDLEWSTPYTG